MTAASPGGMMDQPEFSIVIPAYNEAVAIAPVLRRLREKVKGDYEVVVVDDGSTDGTAEQARQAHPGVRVVQHPCNLGNGAAVKTGIRQSRGAIVVLMDCDGQHDPGEIAALVEGCRRYDMVVGARRGDSQAGLGRRVANWVYNRLASYVTGQRVDDLTSGFRALRRDLACRFLGLLPNRFSYPTTLTICLLRAGYSVLYTPITAARRQGKSKIRPLSDGPRFLLVIMKVCMLYSPLKIFLPISLYTFLMGLGYYGYTFWTTHRFTNMSMLLFTTAVTIFMMGLIAEQIAQMRFERAEGT